MTVKLTEDLKQKYDDFWKKPATPPLCQKKRRKTKGKGWDKRMRARQARKFFSPTCRWHNQPRQFIWRHLLYMLLKPIMPFILPAAPCWNCLIIDWSPAMPPMWWRTRGSIILAICWFNFAICDWLTFLDISPPLKSPLIPPIFFTICANLVYCVRSSWTSLVETPDPRATLWILPGCLLKTLAPSVLSSSAHKDQIISFT